MTYPGTPRETFWENQTIHCVTAPAAATILWPVSMKRSKKTKRSPPSPPTTIAAESTSIADGSEANDPSCHLEKWPDKRVRSLLSVLVAIQLFAVAVSFFGVVEPSETHIAVLQTLSPYLRATHFGAEDRPVYLAYAEPDEQPHRLQILRAGNGEPWQTVEPTGWPGLGQSDRYARWVGTMASLAESERPGLVATLLLPRLHELVAINPTRPIRQVRIIRLPTELTTVVDDAKPPPYLAAVEVHEERIDFVQIKDDRLNAKSLVPASRTIVTREPKADDSFRSRALGRTRAVGPLLVRPSAGRTILKNSRNFVSDQHRLLRQQLVGRFAMVW